MKKILAILLSLAMVLSFAACGGETAEEDPNAGKYLGTTAKALGMTMDMSEIYPGETWLELKSGGKGTIMLDGDDFPIEWSLEGQSITITIDNVDSVGTLSEGVVVVDLMDMGVEMTFLKEGMEMPAVEATYNDAGYWEVIRVESEDPDSAVSEEDMELVKAAGVLMYMELNEDGTGVLYLDEEMLLVWCDGSVTLTEDAMTVSYTLENGELKLDMIDVLFVLQRGEKQQIQETEAVIQSDAGRYDLTRIDSNVPGDASSEEDIQLLKDSGFEMYLELAEGGTGIFCVGSPIDVIWGDGFVEAEGEAFPYRVDGDLMYLGTEEMMFVFCRMAS